MRRTLSLMAAIIGPDGDPGEAQRYLEEAMLTEVDPLLYLALSLHIGVDTAYRRAAAHIGFAFFDVIPAASEDSAPLRLDALADIHMVRVQTIDRDIAYTAPDFKGLMQLQALREREPGLMQRVCIVPPAAMRQYLAHVASVDLVDSARQTLARHWPRAAASLELTFWPRMIFAASLLALVLTLLVMPYLSPGWLMPIWAVFMLLPALVRLAALLMPLREMPPEPRADDLDLPIYSVLVPLRDEAEMVDQLCANLSRLDYPAHRLDIIFVVEQRSPRTVEAVRQHLGNVRFSLIEVPHAMPLTKPKALDFALPFCRGEFVVVFDAEDHPEPEQLRNLVSHFRKAPHLHCIQARLVIANGDKGMLPALFAGEYAALFSVFLPALARWGVFVPLGGTSNHFRLESLRGIGGWDAYNVTEDADLGVRLARRGLGCGTSSMVTHEDAPERFQVWLGQRRRWMKGWMQTILVHNRHPGQLFHDLGWWRFLIFEIVVIGMILAPLLHSGFFFTFLILLTQGQIALHADLWSFTCLTVFAFGYGVALIAKFLGLSRTGQLHLLVGQVLLPFYWLAIAVATLQALYDLTTRPFHWIKTAHRPVSRNRRRIVPAE
ncbi:glycosyltransferase family 2 protein [Devosia soli]|uniref:glycosyltransferase family 2 protein n=1 Tax=Devosia soli TaxID=361041 RepID=UPI000A07737E|nr:glycosyltransferase [Devosia soli]